MLINIHIWWVFYSFPLNVLFHLGNCDLSNLSLTVYHYNVYHSKMAVKNCFIRGSVVRYVQLPAAAMDTQLLEDATRRGEFNHQAIDGVTPRVTNIFSLLRLLTMSIQNRPRNHRRAAAIRDSESNVDDRTC